FGARAAYRKGLRGPPAGEPALRSPCPVDRGGGRHLRRRLRTDEPGAAATGTVLDRPDPVQAVGSQPVWLLEGLRRRPWSQRPGPLRFLLRICNTEGCVNPSVTRCLEKVTWAINWKSSQRPALTPAGEAVKDGEGGAGEKPFLRAGTLNVPHRQAACSAPVTGSLLPIHGLAAIVLLFAAIFAVMAVAAPAQADRLEDRLFFWKKSETKKKVDDNRAPRQSFIAAGQSLEPMLGVHTVDTLLGAIARYQIIVRRGGWPELPQGRELAP